MLLKRKPIRISAPDSSIAEQFRELRTNIYFSSDQKYRTLLISSPGYREGKSTAIIHLAISIAQQGERVLIVDADFRTPVMHTVFQVSSDCGLIDVLNGEVTVEDAVKSTQTTNLFVLPCGSIAENTIEALSSRRLKEVINTALKQFDLILFDSPPVLDVADTRILAHECDGVLLVVSQGRTKEGKILEAKRQLDFAKANLVGVILNQGN